MVQSCTVVKRHTESNEQIAAMDWLRLQHPEVARQTMHIGNERKSSYYAPNSHYHGLFIEVKSIAGKLTEEQKEFIARMNKAGYHARCCYGADSVIETFKWYLKL
jgi:hypothetical protein